MTKAHITAIELALTIALAQYEGTMGQVFPTVPNLVPIADANFWAVADINDGPLTIMVSTGLVAELEKLWMNALVDDDFKAGVGGPINASAEEMTHLGLVWLMLHELHHFEMGHFEFAGRLCLTEAHAPSSFGVVSRVKSQPSPAVAKIDADDLPKVEPCLEMQADHDAIEMLIDAYSPDEWESLRMRTAAISAVMMLIEREDAKNNHEHSSHPKAATRIFQLLGHVIEMPMIQAKIAMQHPELEIEPIIPSDEEQGAFNRTVVISAFFDAVNLARIADAETIREDLGEAQDFFRDVQAAKLADPSQFDDLMTEGAVEWGRLMLFNPTLVQSQ